MKKVLFVPAMAFLAFVYFTSCNPEVVVPTTPEESQTVVKTIAVENLNDYLAGLEENTVDTPYEIMVSGTDLVSVKNALMANPNKYVSLSFTNCESMTSIGNSAFFYCTNLKSVVIPNSVTSIGDYAFEFCTSLESVTIPNSVTSISEYAFRRCGVISFEVDESNPNYKSVNGSLLSKDGTVLIHAGNATGLFSFPNSVTSIGSSAFCQCTSLKSVSIPNGVTSIGSYAFWDCSSLESVFIPNSVTSIGDYAFYQCTSLKSVDIPNSMTSIGTYAFSGCTSLESVTIPNSVTSIVSFAFSDCTSLATINYTGTEEQWNAISKGFNWRRNCPANMAINYNYTGE